MYIRQRAVQFPACDAIEHKARRAPISFFRRAFRRFAFSFPFRVMHARRSALELKLKCAHDLISIWGVNEPLNPSARPIVARNIVVAQVQSPRTDTTCYRSGTTLSRRINRGLRFSKFHRNFLLLISASRKHVETRIFRMRGTRIPLPRMGCEQRRTENERKLRKEFLWWKGRKD